MQTEKRQLVTANLKEVIILSTLLFSISLAIGFLISLLVFDPIKSNTNLWYIDIIIYVVSTAMLIALHEVLHALGFIIFGKARAKDISFGFAPHQGMFYCSCSKVITARAYALTLILPVILTGILPFIFVIIWGNVFWIMIFSIMISGGAGDLIMLNQVIKLRSDQLVLDHPKGMAFYKIYKQGQQLPSDFVEVTQDMERRLLEDMKVSPFDNTKKGIKILLVLLFLSFSIVIMAIIGFLLML